MTLRTVSNILIKHELVRALYWSIGRDSERLHPTALAPDNRSRH